LSCANIAREISSDVINRVHPLNLMRKAVRREGKTLFLRDTDIDLSKYERVYLIGLGKASESMVLSFKEISGIKEYFSLCLLPDYQKITQGRVDMIIKSTHPLPSESSVLAAKKIISILKQTNERDIVFFFISGGSSSLIELPSEPFSIGDIARITKLMLLQGADIKQLNTVRIAVSSIKGGRLLKYIRCNKVFSLILSDVFPHDLNYVGSGLTFPFARDISTAKKLMEEYGIDRELISKLSEIREEFPFTYPEVKNIEIGSNRDAVLSAEDKLLSLGFQCSTGLMEGYASEFGKKIAREAERMNQKEAYIFGGETTVNVMGKGKGGRNQETVLSALIEIEGIDKTNVFSFTTDGRDGPTEAAGAFADSKTASEARILSINPVEYLKNNDSYTFFKKLNRLIVTGETGTNVADVAVVLKE
jgi:glycerate 2-kinase